MIYPLGLGSTTERFVCGVYVYICMCVMHKATINEKTGDEFEREQGGKGIWKD